MTVRLRLASKSETRRAMLAAADIPFSTVYSALDEDQLKAALRGEGLGAASLALRLAEAKALAADAPGDLVLGADQTLETEGGRMLDKPVSRDDALAQLQALSGASHQLHSAGVIIRDGVVAWSAIESVTLTMRPLSRAFLETYLDQEYEAIRWSVGGYRIEGRGAQLFERIEGSHFAILGLPLLPLLSFLRAEQVVAA